MSFPFAVGDIAAVETHPHRHGPFRLGAVVFLDGPLDGHGRFNGVARRGKESHEPVPEPLDVGAATSLEV